VNKFSPPCGEILLSFIVAEADFRFKTPIAAMKLKKDIKF